MRNQQAARIHAAIIERTNLKAAFAAIVSRRTRHAAKEHGCRAGAAACGFSASHLQTRRSCAIPENDVLSARVGGLPHVIVVETGYNEGKSLSDLDARCYSDHMLHAARDRAATLFKCRLPMAFWTRSPAYFQGYARGAWLWRSCTRRTNAAVHARHSLIGYKIAPDGTSLQSG